MMDWGATLGLTVLAVYSNFTLLNYLACLLPVGLAIVWWKKKERTGSFHPAAWRTMLWIDAVVSALLLLLVGPQPRRPAMGGSLFPRHRAV